MKNSIRMVLSALVLGVAAYTNSANATLISSGTSADGTFLIYDNVNNITWYDSVFIDTGTALNVTKTLASTAGWTLPSIGQLTTLHTQLGLTTANASNPAQWAPFGTEPNPDSDFLGSLPDYGTWGDTFVSSTLSSGKLERETLSSGYISLGTSSGLSGDGLYEHAGQVSVPDGGATALLLGMSLGGLHLLRRRI